MDGLIFMRKMATRRGRRTSCLYAVLDIQSDILEKPGVQSDARMLEEETHIPTLIWGLLWISIALGASISLVFIASKRESEYEPLSSRTRG